MAVVVIMSARARKGREREKRGEARRGEEMCTPLYLALLGWWDVG